MKCFLKTKGKLSEAATRIKDRLKGAFEDVDGRITQYLEDRFYLEAVYLARHLFDLWRDFGTFRSKCPEVIPAHYDPASMVSLYEKIGDFPAAELAQEEVISNLSCLDHTSSIANNLANGIKNLLRLYSLNRHRLSTLGTLNDMQISKALLHRAAQIDFHAIYYLGAPNTPLETLIESMKRQADLNRQDKDGWTALNIAADSGHEVLLGLLLQMKANTNIKTHDSNTALHAAVNISNKGCVRLLLENGVDANADNDQAGTPLHMAVSQGWESGTRILLKYGVDVDIRSTLDGKTALHYAVKGRHKRLVSMLLEHGANADLKTNHGKAAIHVAAQCDSTDSVQILLEHRANVNLKSGNGEAAIHIATMHDSTDLIQTLHRHGADINIKDRLGQTALYLAARLGFTSCAQTLIEGKADVNVGDCCETTALHMAIVRGHKEIVELFLESGANIEAKDDWGENALQLAIRTRFKDITELLKPAVHMPETATGSAISQSPRLPMPPNLGRQSYLNEQTNFFPPYGVSQ